MKVSFSGKTYDILKWSAMILLPSVAMLYGSLSPVWGFPYSKEIVGTIAAVDVLLGTLLGISSYQYRNMVRRTVLVVQNKPVTRVAWILTDQIYDVGIWISQLVLPALATFYYGVAVIWNLPATDKVVTTIMALDTFLGMLIGFSSAQYNKTALLAKVVEPQE